MKKTSQDFSIDGKNFVIELLESSVEDNTEYSNLVIVTMNSCEGYQQLHFNSHDKAEEAKKQYETIVGIYKQLFFALTKPIEELKVIRTHNCYWMWD